MDKLDDILADFGEALGMENLTFVDDERRIDIDGVPLDLIADRKRGWIVLSSYVGNVPDGDRTEILARLLHANCGPDMGGAALGVPADGDVVVLTDQIRADRLTVSGLVDRIEPFLAAVAQARRLLTARAAEAPKAAAPVDLYGMLRV